MRNKFCTKYLTGLSILTLSGMAYGSESQDSKPFKNTFYLGGANLSQIDYAQSNNVEIEGMAFTMQFGYGKIYPYYITHLTFDYIHGPFTKTLNDELNIDYSGTGVSWSNFFQINTSSIFKLRSTRGLSLVFSYHDQTGKTFGSNLKSEYGELNGQAIRYEINHTGVFLSPGVFYSWHTEPRPVGNKPELLMTRIEGYILNLSVKVPVYSTFKTTTSYEYNDSTQSRPSSKTETGGLSGIGIEVSISTLLGV